MPVKRDISSVSYKEMEDLAIKIKALPGNTMLGYSYFQGREVFLSECYKILRRIRRALELLEKVIHKIENELEDGQAGKIWDDVNRAEQ